MVDQCILASEYSGYLSLYQFVMVGMFLGCFLAYLDRFIWLASALSVQL